MDEPYFSKQPLDLPISHSITLQDISMDELVCLDISALYQWGSEWFGPQHRNKDNLRKAIKRLNHIVEERKRLDVFLYTTGKRIEFTRLYVFKRMCLLSRDRFNTEFDQNCYPKEKYLPSDEEILLESFLKYMMQYNPFYKKVKVSQIITSERPMYKGKFGKKNFFIVVKIYNNHLIIFIE